MQLFRLKYMQLTGTFQMSSQPAGMQKKKKKGNWEANQRRKIMQMKCIGG